MINVDKHRKIFDNSIALFYDWHNYSNGWRSTVWLHCIEVSGDHGHEQPYCVISRPWIETACEL